MNEEIIGYQRQGYGYAPAQMGYAGDPGSQSIDFGGGIIQPQGYGYNPNFDPQGDEVNALTYRNVQQPQMAIRSRGGVRLQRQWYGFPRTEICPGETVKIVGQVQVLTKIIRLFIDDSVNTSLLVCSLVIAKNDLINGDCVSATLFSPLSQDAYPQTATETIQAGCSASITLENIGSTKLLVIVSASVAIAW